MKLQGNTAIMFLAGTAVLGAVAGAAAGALSSDLWLSPRIDRLADLLANTSSTPSVPQRPPVVIVPLENRPIAPSYPQALVDRRTSPVLQIVRHTHGAADDVLLASDHILGTSVALTSDGWILSSESVLGVFKLSDLGIAYNGRVYPVVRGERDLSTGLIFLKFDVSGLPVVSFARASDVSSGIAVWVESAPGLLVPDVIADASWQSPAAVSSERVGRRFILGGKNYAAGSAVWDSAGRLLGLVQDDTVSQVIPADSAGDFLSGILSDGTVRHASLGLRTIDLSDAVFDTASSSLPTLGSWVRTKGTAAGSKSLQEGDVIERIERDILDGSADLGELLLDYRPDAQVTLSINRKGQSLQVSATLGSFNAAEPLK